MARVARRGDIFEDMAKPAKPSLSDKFSEAKSKLKSGLSSIGDTIKANSGSTDYINNNPDNMSSYVNINRNNADEIEDKSDFPKSVSIPVVPPVIPTPPNSPPVTKVPLTEQAKAILGNVKTKLVAIDEEIGTKNDARNAANEASRNKTKEEQEAYKTKLKSEKEQKDDELAIAKKFEENEILEKEKEYNRFGPRDIVGEVNDPMAIEGGSNYTNKFIVDEDNAIFKFALAQESAMRDRSQSAIQMQSQIDALDPLITEAYTSLLEANKRYKVWTADTVKTPEGKADALNLSIKQKEYDDLFQRRSILQNVIKSNKYESDPKFIMATNQINKRLAENSERRAQYNKAIIIGKAKVAKESGISGFRSELKNFGDNASSMIGKPNVGDITDTVNYGPLSAVTVGNAFNNLIKPVQVAPGGGEWFKTKAGDRSLVEGLVSSPNLVSRNNMISPFGSSGTVAGGSINKQFTYDIPLNRIGVGDVTARPGYRINIEDIRRKRDAKSKPKITRTIPKVIPSKKVSGISIGGNLKMNIPTFPILHSEKNGGLNNTGLINGNFKINTPKIKDTMKVNIGKSKSSDLLNVNKTSLGSLKVNITPLNINANKPQNNMVKINADGIVPFTFKNIEVNLNSVSSAMKKKMKVKV